MGKRVIKEPTSIPSSDRLSSAVSSTPQVNSDVSNLQALMQPIAHAKTIELRKRGLLYFHIRDPQVRERVAYLIEQLNWQVTDFGNLSVQIFFIMQDAGYFTDGSDIKILNSTDKKDTDKLIAVLKRMREPIHLLLRDYIYKRSIKSSDATTSSNITG